MQCSDIADFQGIIVVVFVKKKFMFNWNISDNLFCYAIISIKSYDSNM